MVPYRLHLLMPTYNRAHMLEQTLETLSRQDADPALWHITVVDNASTDDTVKLLENYAAAWPNFDFTVNESNLGLFGNLNRCMDLARTQKYMIIHSDDGVSPTLVSTVLNFLDRNPDTQMCFGRCQAEMVETGQIIETWYRSSFIGDSERKLDHRTFITALFCSGSNFIFPPTVVYDRTFFSAELRYAEQYALTADFDLWFRAAMKKPMVGFMPDSLISCRIHSERLSANHADAMRLEFISIIRKYIQLLRGRDDMHTVDDRSMKLIEWKLRIFELAIRLHLNPGFKLRRRIMYWLERMVRISN